MAKLRLKNPTLAAPVGGESPLIEVDVSIDAPVPHLDGEYTYCAEEGSVRLGSLVKVPFGHGETSGFVTRIGSQVERKNKYKRVASVLVESSLFDQWALNRYRSIVERYGGSLNSLLKIAIPVRRSLRSPSLNVKRNEIPLKPSTSDRLFIERHFGGLDRSQIQNLLMPAGLLWDHVAISIYLADPVRTAIMVPTERDLEILESALRERGITDYVELSSKNRESERYEQFHQALTLGTTLIIGNRSIAYLPTRFDRLLIVDPGHFSYQELRSPYLRSDDLAIWQNQVITISHTRELATLAVNGRYVRGSSGGRYQSFFTSPSKLVSDIQAVIRRRSQARTILISLNDRSFASGLHCSKCKNRSVCSCGFPLRILQRGEAPSCTKCDLRYPEYRCPYCSETRLKASRSGNASWALSMARSIKGARVILSDAHNPKNSIVASKDELCIIIATLGCEPRVFDKEGRYCGYDLMALLGGETGFNSATLSKSDQYRRAWARNLGLVNPKEATVLLDLDQTHIEVAELMRVDGSPGIELLLKERMALGLPPYTILVEISGEERVLMRLKRSLEEDELFSRSQNVIYPPHGERMVVKVASDDRFELLKLLQTVVRLRSAKRLTPIKFILAPNSL